jgi:hypothetical protein
MNDTLLFSCAELRELAETNPEEIEVIVEMLIEADEDLCQDIS